MSFKITPIGGVDQIGSNMLLIEGPQGHSVIDCGILFPFEDFFNINYLIPNFYSIPRPNHVFITHGHEDHIGALPHLCEHFPDLHIIAPPFAATLIKNKFDFYPRKLKYKLEVLSETTYESSGLEFDYVQVNHSIPDTYGIHVTSPKSGKGFFYVSDFKVDPLAQHEPYFDFKKLQKLRSKLTESLLMADSTNITSSLHKTTSETELLPALTEIFQGNYKRVFVTTFSSNIHRILNIIETSSKANRKVVLYGRSVKNYYQAAIDNDMIKASTKVYDIDEVDQKSDLLTVIVSGCQGDFRSTFRRIAFRQDSYFKLNENDLFVLSSKSIPGNEKKISLCLNQIALQNCPIITAADKLIHTSGHAGKTDLETLFKEYDPDYFIPIHGESFFLQRHGEWVKSLKDNLKTSVIHNHDTFNVDNHEIYTHQSPDDFAPIIIHADALVFDRDSIRERRKISEAGFVSIVISAEIKFKSDIFLTGITIPPTHTEVQVVAHIEKLLKKNHKNKKDNSEQMRIEVRRFLQQIIGERPVVRVSYL